MDDTFKVLKLSLRPNQALHSLQHLHLTSNLTFKILHSHHNQMRL